MIVNHRAAVYWKSWIFILFNPPPGDDPIGPKPRPLGLTREHRRPGRSAGRTGGRQVGRGPSRPCYGRVAERPALPFAGWVAGDDGVGWPPAGGLAGGPFSRCSRAPSHDWNRGWSF